MEDAYVALEQTVVRQAEVISELQRRPGRNSGKPPSSDGLGKPPATKRTSVKGRRPGGQMSNKGHALLSSEKPDHVERHFPLGNRAIITADGPIGKGKA